MLQLNNITKSFADGHRNLTVLNHLSLEVEDGEFVAIIGESGAGKTTLLSILGTLIPADEGSYMIHQQIVEACNVNSLRNKEIGMLYQDHRLLPQFTVMQNVLMPVLATKSASIAEEEQRAIELLTFMGVAELRDSSVTTLSGGEKTRVAICRALINQPSILLADEPTGQLDANNAHVIAELFTKVNRELHTTIVMVTHSREMAGIAQKTYVLRNGQLSLLNP